MCMEAKPPFVCSQRVPPLHVGTHPPAVRDPFYRFKDSSLHEKKGRCQDTRCGAIQDHS